MKTYDVVFILDEKRVEDAGDTFATEVEQFVATLGGVVKQRIPMGRRVFARPIGKSTAGIYLEFVTDFDPAKIAEFKEKFRLNATVLRLVVFHYQEPQPAGKEAVAASRI